MKTTSYEIQHYSTPSMLKARESNGGAIITTIAGSRLGGSYVSVSGSKAALQLPIVNRCVSLIAESIAKVPIHYERMKADGTFIEFPDGKDVHYCLTIQPNSRMSWDTFIKTIVIQCCVGNGNAWGVPVYNGGELSEIALVTEGCAVYNDLDDTVSICDPYNTHLNRIYRANEIFHWFIRTNDGINGVSIVNFAKQQMNLCATADAETLDRIASGGLGRGIVGGGNEQSGQIYAGEHDYDELEQVAVDVETQWRQGRRIASIPEDVNYTGVNMTSADLEFLSTRKYNNKLLCLFFGIDPSMVGEESSSNYKSAENAEANFRSTTLEAWLRMIENELQRKLIPRKFCHKYRIRFDRSKLDIVDVKDKADYWQKMLQGIMTVNEVRAKEGLKPVENGDKMLVSANLKTIEGLMSESSDIEPEPTEDNQYGE